MATFTSSLPDELLEKLSKMAKELKVPKNKLIEKALQSYLEEITRIQYVQSFKRANKSKEILDMAEEGMGDYFKMLTDLEKE